MHANTTRNSQAFLLLLLYANLLLPRYASASNMSISVSTGGGTYSGGTNGTSTTIGGGSQFGGGDSSYDIQQNYSPGADVANRIGWGTSGRVNPSFNVSQSAATNGARDFGLQWGSTAGRDLSDQPKMDGMAVAETGAHSVGITPLLNPFDPEAFAQNTAFDWDQAPGGVTAEARSRDAATGASDNGSDPVNPGTGEFTEQWIDLALPGIGLPLAIVRTYRSQATFNGPIGYGWDLSVNQRLVSKESPCGAETVIWSTGAATTVTFSRINGRYQSEKDTGYRLEQRPAIPGWTLHHPDGVRSLFDANGLLTERKDLNGNTLLFSWKDVGRPEQQIASATDTLGRTIDFSYDSFGYLERIDAPALNATLYYSVDQSGDLASTANAAGIVETYSYIGAQPPESFIADTVLYQSCKKHCGLAGPGCDVNSPCSKVADQALTQCMSSCASSVEDCAPSCNAECNNPLCQCRVRQLPLDISVPMGGEWCCIRAQAFPKS